MPVPHSLNRSEFLRAVAPALAGLFLLPAALRAAPGAPGAGPRLWFTARDLSRLRDRARQGWPKAIAEGARVLAEQAESSPSGAAPARLLEALALTYILTGDPRHARRAEQVTSVLLEPDLRSDLGTAAQLQAAVIACDLCGTAWAPDRLQDFARLLRTRAERLAGTTLSGDNPDNPFNNWWGVTHSVAALTALWLGGHDPSVASLLAREDERVRTYLLNYGDHGHYYEGTGYGFYAMSHWAPYLLASRHAWGRDPAAGSAGIPRLPALAHALTVARPQVNDTDSESPPERRGMRIFWNDDSGHGARPEIAALLLALAPSSQQAELRWLHDRLTGPEGDRSDASGHGGCLWPFLYYPAEVTPRQPIGPLFCHDQRTGLVVMRNRYQDGDDCVFATYAKSYHAGGHVQEDLGSWRFQGLGAGWAQGGGQAKAAAHFQCVVTRDGRANDGRHGQISYLVPLAAGEGAVSLRLGPASGSRRWDRHFAIDYSGASGVPALLGAVDECTHEAEAEWTWSLCFERQLRFVAAPERNGFSLHDPSGASLAFTFGSPGNLAFELQQSPTSSRTFSNGSTRVYPGVPYVTARVRARQTTFFAVATLQRGDAPAVEWQRERDDALPSAVVGPRRVQLSRGKWFHGPLRIGPV